MRETLVERGIIQRTSGALASARVAVKKKTRHSRDNEHVERTNARSGTRLGMTARYKSSHRPARMTIANPFEDRRIALGGPRHQHEERNHPVHDEVHKNRTIQSLPVRLT